MAFASQTRHSERTELIPDNVHFVVVISVGEWTNSLLNSVRKAGFEPTMLAFAPSRSTIWRIRPLCHFPHIFEASSQNRTDNVWLEAKGFTIKL